MSTRKGRCQSEKAKRGREEERKRGGLLMGAIGPLDMASSLFNTLQKMKKENMWDMIYPRG